MKTERNGRFTASLVFAALAGLATPAYLLVVSSSLGLGRALELWSVVVVAAAVFVMSPNRLRGLRCGLLSLSLGLGVYVLAPPIVVLFGSGVLLGLVRSSFLYPPGRGIGRAFFLESALFLVGSFMARLVVGETFVSYGLAVWTFLLVESAFFLFEGSRVQQEISDGEDVLERALREASRLMEESP